MISQEQRRAAHALSHIHQHQHAGVGEYGNYVSYVSSLSATILMDGLGQACATLRSRQDKDKGYKLLFEDIESWLCDKNTGNTPNNYAPYRGQGNLLSAIIEGESELYFRAQEEALAYVVWLKKLARAYLERGEGQ
jgi:CRISPR-associated protein Cmr5